MKCWWTLVLLFLSAYAAAAQATPTSLRTEIPVGVRFVGTAANSPPGTCGCFWLLGAGVDAAIPLWHGVSLAVDLAGDTTKHVPSTTRGLSVITLLAGPRYSLPIRHRVTLQAQALFGVARGFDADFIVSTGTHTDTANVFGASFGGAVEIPLKGNVTLRPVEAEYLQTYLPNGDNNRQKNLRVGAGVVFRIALPRSR